MSPYWKRRRQEEYEEKHPIKIKSHKKKKLK